MDLMVLDCISWIPLITDWANQAISHGWMTSSSGKFCEPLLEEYELLVIYLLLYNLHFQKAALVYYI